MDVEEKAECLPAEGLERRMMPRCAVDVEATLLLVHHGSLLRCRLVELSLEGCRMSVATHPPPGALVRVEASFKVRGISFRFSGVGAWTDSQKQIGIRFLDMPLRRRDELAEVLCEAEAENAVKAEKMAAEEQSAEAGVVEKPNAGQATHPALQAQSAVDERAGKDAAKRAEEQARREAGARAQVLAKAELPRFEPRQAPLQPAALPPGKSAKPSKRERRVQSRHEVDTSAIILLINIGSRLQGRILDLSESGCRIRSDERFPVGIYTRIEIEFRLEGLPFRLGGVIQAIHDRNHVGIRFLDVSERKREQVEQLIEEIEEMRARRTLDKLEDAG